MKNTHCSQHILKYSYSPIGPITSTTESRDDFQKFESNFYSRGAFPAEQVYVSFRQRVNLGQEAFLAAYKLCAIASWGLRIAEIHLFMYEAFIPKVLDIAYQER